MDLIVKNSTFNDTDQIEEDFNNDLLNDGIGDKSDLDASKGGRNTSKVNISIPLSKEDKQELSKKFEFKKSQEREMKIISKIKKHPGSEAQSHRSLNSKSALSQPDRVIQSIS